jgi:hypothetical protein
MSGARRFNIEFPKFDPIHEVPPVQELARDLCKQVAEYLISSSNSNKAPTPKLQPQARGLLPSSSDSSKSDRSSTGTTRESVDDLSRKEKVEAARSILARRISERTGKSSSADGDGATLCSENHAPFLAGVERTPRINNSSSSTTVSSLSQPGSHYNEPLYREPKSTLQHLPEQQESSREVRPSALVSAVAMEESSHHRTSLKAKLGSANGSTSYTALTTVTAPHVSTVIYEEEFYWECTKPQQNCWNDSDAFYFADQVWRFSLYCDNVNSAFVTLSVQSQYSTVSASAGTGDCYSDEGGVYFEVDGQKHRFRAQFLLHHDLRPVKVLSAISSGRHYLDTSATHGRQGNNCNKTGQKFETVLSRSDMLSFVNLAGIFTVSVILTIIQFPRVITSACPSEQVLLESQEIASPEHIHRIPDSDSEFVLSNPNAVSTGDSSHPWKLTAKQTPDRAIENTRLLKPSRDECFDQSAANDFEAKLRTLSLADDTSCGPRLTVTDSSRPLQCNSRFQKLELGVSSVVIPSLQPAVAKRTSRYVIGKK